MSSSTLLDQFVSLLQSSNGSAKPKDDRPFAKASGFLLIRLLNSQKFDGEAVVTNHEDFGPITFGDLLDCRTENAKRSDGSTGVDYPLVWDLSHTDGSAAIDYLKSCPAKPKASGNFKPKASRKSDPQPEGLTQELLLSLLSKLIENPAKPEGFEKSGPAKPVEPVAIEINVGDVVSINGELRQVVGEAGKYRLNKTLI